MTTPEPPKNIALVFPGIGVELSGFETGLLEWYPSVFKPCFDVGSQEIHKNLADFFSARKAETLDEWEQQVATYCFSVGMAQVYTDKKISPAYMAGYSFGVYAALVAAGALSFADGFALVKQAYAIMRNTCTGIPVCVTVIIGLSFSEISSILQAGAFQGVRRINSNNAFCHVLCGPCNEMERIHTEALNADAINCVNLPVSLPYHHPVLAAGTNEKLARFCDTLSWRSPRIPIVSTIDQQRITSVDGLKRFVADHLSTPIHWCRTVEALYEQGVTDVFECGPGISLTQNARFIPGNARWTSVKNYWKRWEA